MQGLMQRQPLLLSSLMSHAARHHGGREIVSKQLDGSLHRTTWRELQQRSRRLARVLAGLGVQMGGRVGTLAWNGFRHLELFYGVSGSGAVCHTINPRLATDDVAYIAQDGGDVVLFADLSFSGLVQHIAPRLTGALRAVVMLCGPAEMPILTLPPGMALLCYESLMAASDDTYVWPDFDENAASALCYTSGTTGKPKGVLYSHRAAVLHATMAISPDVFCLRATDVVLPGASMYHATAWGLPYCAALVGAKLVLSGNYLDGASLYALMEQEGVTFMVGVPTIWLGLLQYLRETGQRPTTLQRLLAAGSACPRVLIDSFGAWGVDVQHAWGMTETTPVVTYNAPTPATAHLAGEHLAALKLRQGRCMFGADFKIVDDEDRELPWDGKVFGALKVRRPWVTREYMHRGADGAADADGWLTTGDVATVDENGFVELVDRTKDLIKSGGEWISSIALENIAVSHPDVLEAAAIAVPHPKWVERPLVLVVCRPSATVTEQDVLALYEGQVAKWSIPDRIVVVPELPHTATGKLNKLALREAWR